MTTPTTTGGGEHQDIRLSEVPPAPTLDELATALRRVYDLSWELKRELGKLILMLGRMSSKFSYSSDFIMRQTEMALSFLINAIDYDILKRRQR